MALLQAEIPLWKITKDGWPENRASRGVCRGSGLASRSRTRFVGNCQSGSDERILASANLSCMRSF